jgi:hypothetical protein
VFTRPTRDLDGQLVLGDRPVLQIVRVDPATGLARTQPEADQQLVRHEGPAAQGGRLLEPGRGPRRKPLGRIHRGDDRPNAVWDRSEGCGKDQPHLRTSEGLDPLLSAPIPRSWTA